MTPSSAKSETRILVAGIGNIFHGDDAFGVELAQRLMRRNLPEGVKVVDFGIRSFDLAYALLDGPEIVILLDATQRGEAPGTLYTVEIDPDQPDDNAPTQVDAHGMNPMHVLEMVRKLGGTNSRILLIGCEPLCVGSEEEGAFGLTATVSDAVDHGVEIVEALICELSETFSGGRIECQELT